MSTATTETIQAQGKSGTTYSFDVCPWGTQFDPVGGVYLVLKMVPGRTDLIYVGQTANLSERFENHHRRFCFDRHGKTHIAALREDGEARRLRIEQDLIENYKPDCNETV